MDTFDLAAKNFIEAWIGNIASPQAYEAAIDELATMLENAFNEGFDLGFEEGYNEGLEKNLEERLW